MPTFLSVFGWDAYHNRRAVPPPDVPVIDYQDPVVQSIVSLTSSLRGQLIKCFTTFQPNTLNFFVEKSARSFFRQKILACLRY